jgi:uncharacterized peroxidase-related enzyme
MAYIQTTDYEASEGRLREIYDDIIQKRGKLAELHKLQSLHPETIVQHMELYMELMFRESPLERAQREMMAVVVSAANNCEYCIEHHSAALEHFWEDEEQVEDLQEDYHLLGLSQANKALCDYASALTSSPGKITDETHIQPMRGAGWDDRAILDAGMIVAYFNFVNRLVLGLGASLEADGGEGYNYE